MPATSMDAAKPTIEQMSLHDLIKEWLAEVSALERVQQMAAASSKAWKSELGALEQMEGDNPTWEWRPVQARLEALHALAQPLRESRAQAGGAASDWRPVQARLENLHALAQELRRKKALERAKWQP